MLASRAERRERRTENNIVVERLVAVGVLWEVEQKDRGEGSARERKAERRARTNLRGPLVAHLLARLLHRDESVNLEVLTK